MCKLGVNRDLDHLADCLVGLKKKVIHRDNIDKSEESKGGR